MLWAAANQANFMMPLCQLLLIAVVAQLGTFMGAQGQVAAAADEQSLGGGTHVRCLLQFSGVEARHTYYDPLLFLLAL